MFDFLPKENTFLMGDYNLNFLNKAPDPHYEECIFASNFAPVISIATHIRPNSEPSCIDNILTNNSEITILTGTLSDNITHHLLIFRFTKHKCPYETTKSLPKIWPCIMSICVRACARFSPRANLKI